MRDGTDTGALMRPHAEPGRQHVHAAVEAGFTLTAPKLPQPGE